VKKRALVTGVTGQDGSYLAEFLLEKGYQVFGMIRRSSTNYLDRIHHLENHPDFEIIHGDLTDLSSLIDCVKEADPDEVYNLAAMSFVKLSFTEPALTADVTGVGITRLLEAVRKEKPTAKVYQASSSEMFGKVRETPQTELTPFHPRSPYGAAKCYAHYISVNYRESYGLFVCCGILFNHESPRRGLEFVTKKITHTVARIKLGLDKELRLGNMDAKRDWGYAEDYVEAMWLMLQQEEPSDYVIATGQTHSVQEFVEAAFGSVGLDWKDYVVIDEKFMRPAEVDLLVGDYSEAKKELGWEPKVRFEELVEIMVKSDLEEIEKEIKRY